VPKILLWLAVALSGCSCAAALLVASTPAQQRVSSAALEKRVSELEDDARDQREDTRQAVRVLVGQLAHDRKWWGDEAGAVAAQRAAEGRYDAALVQLGSPAPAAMLALQEDNQ
jgi:hypothetical protein